MERCSEDDRMFLKVFRQTYTAFIQSRIHSYVFDEDFQSGHTEVKLLKNINPCSRKSVSVSDHGPVLEKDICPRWRSSRYLRTLTGGSSNAGS